jgi:hypothetical protein
MSKFEWKAGSHPPDWEKCGTIDIADPADVQWALDRGYRIGVIYDGGTRGIAEPCHADIYKLVEAKGPVHRE